jgi:hypothetical protein
MHSGALVKQGHGIMYQYYVPQLQETLGFQDFGMYEYDVFWI